MDQAKLVDDIQEKAIDSLPDEAIIKLAEMPDDVDNETLREFLAGYGVDMNAVAKNVVEEAKHE